MKAAAASLNSIDFDIQGNIGRIAQLLTETKEKRAGYLFLGESSLNGFDGLTWKYDIDIIENAFEPDGKVITDLIGLCKKYETGLGIGFYEKHDQKISSSYFIFNEKGHIESRYRRISKGWKYTGFNDNRYCNGQEYEFVKLGNSKCLISVCGDLWTPEYIEGLKKYDFDTILWPVYLDYTVNEWKYEAEKEFCDQIKLINKRAILINCSGARTDSAKGGVMEISPFGDINQKIEMESSKVMIFDL